MDKHAMWKWLILVGLVVWSVALVTPLRDKIKLGLDLKGGTSYVLQVDTSALDEEAKKDAQARALEIIRNRVDSMGVAEPIIYPEPGNNRIVVQIPGLRAEDRERALKNLQSAAYLEFRMVHPKNDDLVEDLFAKNMAPPGYKIVSVDEQGYGGQWRTTKYYKREGKAETDPKQAQIERERLRSFQAPAGYEFMFEKVVKQGQDLYRPYFVSRRAELKGEALKNAWVEYQSLGQPIVSLRFDSKGAKRFAQVTSDYAPGGAKNPSPDGRRYLAIVLDGTLYSAPFIKTPIHGGAAIIEGSFSVKDAQDLAVVLRAGALPAPVTVVEERTVDPSLGRDSIESGKRAAIVGGIAVLAFMLVYYMLCGLVADFAILLDLLLLPLSMMAVAGFFNLFDTSGLGGGVSLPTITLPGIAGIILMLGMAVDANVLIFERMREEQLQGKRPEAVVAAGYDKAFSAIFDSNITTVIAAAIMFWMGSGPVRGYAVTLTAGILCSMYTAIVVTRMVFNLLLRHARVERFRMLRLISGANLDFIGKRFIAIGLSVAVILVSMAVFYRKGPANFSVDFTGGATITFKFTEKQPVDAVRAVLNEAGIKTPVIQYQRVGGQELDKPVEYLEIKVPFEDGDKAAAAVAAKLPGYEVMQKDRVGPQVGSELKKKGIRAILTSLIFMVIYLAWRFEFGFAVGAVVALLHDVLITVGVYGLLGRELSMIGLAAVLTIIGYSVNDTIVIFDRIREDLKLYRGKSFREIANVALNQTLSRTLLTSLTTLISVVALLVLGGGAINEFALLLLIGIVTGTYSSIFIATPIAMLWHPEKTIRAQAEAAKAK
jgi:SecD/SecF fusion protein